MRQSVFLVIGMLMAFGLSQSAGAASGRCNLLFKVNGAHSSTELDFFLRDPLSFWTSLNQRAALQARTNPKRPRHFLVAEFRSNLEYMILHLELRFKEIGKKGSKKEIKLLRLLLEKAQTAVRDKYPYDLIVELAFDFTIAMDQKYLERDTDERVDAALLHLERGEAPPQVASYIKNRYLYLFPTHLPLSSRHFVWTRSAPVFFLETSAFESYADSNLLRPSEKFEHDVYHMGFQMDIPTAYDPYFINVVTERDQLLKFLRDAVSRVRDAGHRTAIEVVLFYLFHEKGTSVNLEEIMEANNYSLITMVQRITPRMKPEDLPRRWFENERHIVSDVKWVMDWLEQELPQP